MKMRVILLFLSVTCSCLSPAFGVQPLGGEVNEQVRSIILEVETASRQFAALDEFGKKTVDQGKAILSIGPAAVYELSARLDNPDWKVRFWIIDILGYLENNDAKNILIKVSVDRKEYGRIREQARRSLKLIDSPLERNIR